MNKLWLLLVFTGFLFFNSSIKAQTPYPMASGNYLENFSDIANWTDNFASGTGANRFASVGVVATGTIPDGIKTTVATSVFKTTASSGGLQRGSLSGNPAGTIVMLSTGSPDNTNACAIDLLLDFTNRNAGSISFDWASVNNSTGNRGSSLKVYTSTDGSTFTELTGAAVLNFINNAATSGSITNITLPASFNNSATARIRFYEYNGNGGTTGSRPKISIDNISVTSTPAGIVTPVKLAITNVNSSSSPSNLTPFSITVAAQDDLNNSANVTLETSFSLSLATGTGSLGGTVTGTIAAGTSSVVVTGVTYSIPETGVSITATRTSGEVLLAGTSSTFTVLEKANTLALVNVPGVGLTGNNLATFTVEARRTDASVDLNFTQNITISKTTGSGNISGTLVKAAAFGVASFNDVQFDQGDTYTITASASGLTSATSGDIVVSVAPSVTENIVPLYCGSNVAASRTAAVAYITLSGLTDATSYDFHVGGSSSGIGSYAVFDPSTGAALTNLTTLPTGATYTANMFTTSGTSKELVVVLIPSSNAAFAPGSTINLHYFLRVNGGSVVINDVSGAPITCLNYSTTAAMLNGEANIDVQGKFIFAWDNVDGTGRPLSGCVGESNGITEPSYPASYLQTAGTYGFLIPSTNANGVRRFAVYGPSPILSPAPFAVATSETGFSGTVNPTSGTDVPISNAIAPLPVELNSFTASVTGKSVNLNWSTASEVNNQGFDVERSSDNSTWTRISFVKGSGNSNTVKQYSYSDNSIAKSGKYSYRLKQIDNNGQFHYSSVVNADLSKPVEFTLTQNFPNPFNPSTVISYALPEASNVKLIVYNAIGQAVRVLENGFKSAGIYNVSFNANELTSGIYFYKIDAGKFSQVRKMLLVK